MLLAGLSSISTATSPCPRDPSRDPTEKQGVSWSGTLAQFLQRLPVFSAWFVTALQRCISVHGCFLHSFPPNLHSHYWHFSFLISGASLTSLSLCRETWKSRFFPASHPPFLCPPLHCMVVSTDLWLGGEGTKGRLKGERRHPSHWKWPGGGAGGRQERGCVLSPVHDKTTRMKELF